MKINVEYLDNEIVISNDNIFNIEIENKAYFYRLINDLNYISNSIDLLSEDNIKFFKDGIELNLFSKIDMYIDYFNIDFNSKKIINALYKSLKNNIFEGDKSKINSYYLKIKNILSKSFLDYNLPLLISSEYDIDTILKLLKVSIEKKKYLLDNLLILIDINSTFKINELLIFVNLKQYLNKEELNELYKYSIYNNVKILLIDSQCYGTCNKYEKKLIIDSNLDEFLI